MQVWHCAGQHWARVAAMFGGVVPHDRCRPRLPLDDCRSRGGLEIGARAVVGDRRRWGCVGRCRRRGWSSAGEGYGWTYSVVFPLYRCVEPMIPRGFNQNFMDSSSQGRTTYKSRPSEERRTSKLLYRAAIWAYPAKTNPLRVKYSNLDVHRSHLVRGSWRGCQEVCGVRVLSPSQGIIRHCLVLIWPQ